MVPAYKSNDRKTVRYISDQLVPLAAKHISDIRVMHRNLIRKLSGTMSFAPLDCRYGGMAVRCETVKLLLDEYLEGKINRIPELEEKRVSIPLSAFGKVETFVL